MTFNRLSQIENKGVSGRLKGAKAPTGSEADKE